MADHLIPRGLIGAPGHAVGHKPKGKPYAFGCNPAAIRRAADAGKVGIDLDLTVNKQGKGYCNHWSPLFTKDKWRDPLGKIPKSRTIGQLTNAQCDRLRYRDPVSKRDEVFMSAKYAAKKCRDAGVIPCYEAKGSKQLRSVDWWRRFKADMDEVGVVPVVMALPGRRTALKAAHDAGLVTVWLWRDTPSGRKIPAWVDLVKSHRRDIYRKSDRAEGPAFTVTPGPTPPRTPPVKDAPMKFVSRAAWGARPRGATTSTHPIGSTRGVTLHWEGPHMGSFPHGQCASKVRSIEAFHRNTRGWADIAYNAIVCPHGYVFEGRGAGVKSAANGNASTNDDWYAVCYLGGERDPFTTEGKQGMHDAVQWLRARGGAGPAVNGHRDHKSTACPGDVIYGWLRSHDFGSTGGTGRTTPAPKKEEDDMSWSEDLARWDGPGVEDKKGDTMHAGQQLNQARGYAMAAARSAARAERAVEALAKALGPEVERAVTEALKDATVQVDVNVTRGQAS